jgi:hypothetical protein
MNVLFLSQRAGGYWVTSVVVEGSMTMRVMLVALEMVCDVASEPCVVEGCSWQSCWSTLVDSRSGIKEGIDLVDSANSCVCTTQGGQLATSPDCVGSGGLYRTWYQEGVAISIGVSLGPNRRCVDNF